MSSNISDVNQAFLDYAAEKLKQSTTTAFEASLLAAGSEKMTGNTELNQLILGITDAAIGESKTGFELALAAGEAGFNAGVASLNSATTNLQTLLEALPQNTVRKDEIISIAVDSGAAQSTANSVSCVDVQRGRSYVFKGRYVNGITQYCTFGYYDENHVFNSLFQGNKSSTDAGFGLSAAFVLPLEKSSSDSTIVMCVVFVSATAIHIWSEDAIASLADKTLHYPHHRLAYDKVSHAIVGVGDGSAFGGHASYAALRIYADASVGDIIRNAEAGIWVDHYNDFQAAFLDHNGDANLRARWQALRHNGNPDSVDMLSTQRDFDSLGRTYLYHDKKHHWDITVNPTTTAPALNTSPMEPTFSWDSTTDELTLNWFKFTPKFKYYTYGSGGWVGIEYLDVQLLDAHADAILKTFRLDGLPARGVLASFDVYQFYPIAFNQATGQLVTVGHTNDSINGYNSFFNSWVA